MPGSDEEWPVSEPTARARALDEAAWVFSGMIWGFDFSYTPYDKTRALAERFELSPITSLSPGELRLSGKAERRPPLGMGAEDEYRYFVECRPGAALDELMSGYGAEPWKGSQGLGKADMNVGVKGRRAAYEDALRQAVRSCLQGLEPNKPRLVKGRVALERPPSLAIRDGFYAAQVRARVMVVEVFSYKVY